MGKYIITFLLCFSCAQVQAQKFALGFRLESTGMHRNFSDGGSDFVDVFFFPSSIQLNLAYYPIENLSVEIRGGREILFDDYMGYDYGLYSKYFISDKVYFTAGMAGHSNSGSSHNLGGTYPVSFLMPAAGIGYNIWSPFGLELQLQKPDNPAISYSGPSSAYIVNTKVGWMVKLSAVFGWKL